MAITKILLDRYSSDDEKFVFASKIFFFVAVFITSCTFHSSWQQNFFLSSKYSILKLLLCFIIPAVSTAFCFYATKSLEFIGKATSKIMILFFVLNELDIIFFKITNRVNFYHFACGLISFFSIFLVASVCFVCSKNKSNRYCGFDRFYNDFFNGYLFLFIYLLFIAYVAKREVSDSTIVNLIPFNGEIKDSFNLIVEREKCWFVKILRTLGNIFFFTTMPLLLSKFIKKHKLFLITIIPILTSFSAEIIQGLTKKGDADIDDIILNTLGTVIGVLIYNFIIKKLLLEEQKCLEL